LAHFSFFTLFGGLWPFFFFLCFPLFLRDSTRIVRSWWSAIVVLFHASLIEMAVASLFPRCFLGAWCLFFHPLLSLFPLLGCSSPPRCIVIFLSCGFLASTPVFSKIFLVCVYMICFFCTPPGDPGFPPVVFFFGVIKGAGRLF